MQPLDLKSKRLTGPARVVCLAVVLATTTTPICFAATLAQAIDAAVGLSLQQERTAAARALAGAVRGRASGLIADAPALRLKGLSDQFTGDDGAYELEAMLDLPLWRPEQRAAQRRLADALDGTSAGLARRLRWETAGEVREAAWSVALADVAREQAAADLKAARALAETLAKREVAGETARMDRLVAEQEVGMLELDLADAMNAFDRAISAYVQLTGQPRLPEPLVEAASADAELPADHPLLADARAAVAEAAAERERVGADGRGTPIVSIGAKSARDEYGLNADHALQLELSIPLGGKRYNRAALAGAERSYTDRGAELHELRRQAERSLIAARLNWRAAAENIELAERRARMAEDALKLRRRGSDSATRPRRLRRRAGRRAELIRGRTRLP
jgi:cobalt-zinc-cadmium efflux system outer membrane protein